MQKITWRGIMQKIAQMRPEEFDMEATMIAEGADGHVYCVEIVELDLTADAPFFVGNVDFISKEPPEPK